MADAADHAEFLAAGERASGVARAKAALAQAGGIECTAGGDEIPAARQQAAPFAVRCVRCQSQFERVNRV